MKTLADIAQVLKKSKKVAIFCHTQPDGDTVGSAMALSYALKKAGKMTDVFCDEPLSQQIYNFIRREEVSDVFANKDYDTMVAVDCGDEFRLGAFMDVFARHSNTVVMDHHMGKPFGKHCYIADFSSTAEIILSLIETMKIELDDKIAQFLYMGLITDTGNFMHANTSKNTFMAAQKLIQYDIKPSTMSRVFFKDSTIARTKLIGRILSRVRSYYSDKFCLVYVLKEDFENFGLDKEAAKSIVDYAININTALVGASIIEVNSNDFRISLRGKDCNVREIAERFGGGGHRVAAGCQMSGFFEDVVDKLVRYVGESFTENNIL